MSIISVHVSSVSDFTAHSAGPTVPHEIRSTTHIWTRHRLPISPTYILRVIFQLTIFHFLRYKYQTKYRKVQWRFSKFVKMVSSSQSLPSLVFFLILLFSPIASVVGLLRAPPNMALISAERMIRDLNLFPNHPINIVDDEVAFSPEAGKIVERRLRFPDSVDPNAAEQLGHHAGYYKIEHSRGARLTSSQIDLKSSFSAILFYCR